MRLPSLSLSPSPHMHCMWYKILLKLPFPAAKNKWKIFRFRRVRAHLRACYHLKIDGSLFSKKNFLLLHFSFIVVNYLSVVNVKHQISPHQSRTKYFQKRKENLYHNIFMVEFLTNVISHVNYCYRKVLDFLPRFLSATTL